MEALVKQGHIDAVRPEGNYCPACVQAKVTRSPFNSKRREVQDPPGPPFAVVEFDIYGPVDVGDPNGFRYLMVFICASVGTVFAQPMRAKSEAVKVLQAFDRWFKLRAQGFEKALGLQQPLQLGCGRSDRDGAFTTTWGATQSAFDDVAENVFQERRFGSPATPQTATTKVERWWGTLRAAVDVVLLQSQLDKRFTFYAMCFVTHVYNRSPTLANKFQTNVAPYTTLGLNVNLQSLVPFGNPCAIPVSPKAKGHFANRTGRIIGYGVDTPGYIVLVDPLPGATDGPPDIRATVHVLPVRDRTSTLPDDYMSAAHTGFIESSPLSTQTTLATAEEVSTMPPTTGGPMLQTVGAAPGSAGSRAALLPRVPSSTVPRISTSDAALDLDAAVVLIQAAATAGKTFTFEQVNPKQVGSKSHRRYEHYKGETTFAGLEAFPGTRTPVLHLSAMAKRGDFVSDVAHGYVTFVDPTVVPTDTVLPTGATPSVPAFSIVAVPMGLCATNQPLTPYEKELLAAVREWHGPGATASQRASAANHNVPIQLVRAAVAATTGEKLIVGSVDDSTLLFDIRSGNRGMIDSQPKLPRTFDKLRMEPDWLTGILPAMKKEIGGLVKSQVWEEVPWEPWMKGRVIPTHRIDERRGDDTNKTRFVAEGNRTEPGVHFDAVATSMPTATAAKMLTSFAAGLGQPVHAADCTQAFINANCGRSDLHIELPILPDEMLTGEFGAGKFSGKVGRLKRALYGLRDSPRLWQKFLLKFLVDDVGARPLVSDRNVIKWSWRGMTLLMVIHVDDILFTPSAPAIHAEFLRLLRAKFTITGGEELVTKFCGYQFRFDNEAQTITMHQEDFARAVLTKYGALWGKPEDTPLRVSAQVMEHYSGTSTDRSILEFAMFIGDLTWLTRTNPRLAFAVQELARFAHNPGPIHFAAARHVLAHLRKNPGQGLTFHGSDKVLNQSYHHRHALIGMTDSGFSHKGAKAVTGCSVHMNGAAIYHVSRRQTTVSQTSAEAETKAAAFIAEALSAIVPLWSEIAGAAHPAVRVFMDNKAAIKQCASGTDTAASAPYLRSKAYCESKIYAGLMWLDFVPGCDNSADMGTKQVRSTAEFEKKDGVLSGAAPFLFESATVTRLLHNKATVGVSKF